MNEIVAIVGSRDWPDPALVRDYISSLDKDDTVISGEARGVDSYAKMAAIENNLCYIGCPAEWDKHGKSAAHIRNREIVKRCDRLVAFWCNGSPGTRFTIEEARRNNKSVLVFEPPAMHSKNPNIV